jgi:hypothetical protein
MSAMTLEQVRDILGRGGINWTYYEGNGTKVQFKDMADAIDAHLTAHAQRVEKVREVVLQLQSTDETGLNAEACYQLGEKLATAIGDSHEHD